MTHYSVNIRAQYFSLSKPETMKYSTKVTYQTGVPIIGFMRVITKEFSRF